MTLSRKTFEEGMTVLQARYRSAFDPALLSVYFARLNPELTNDEFKRAIALCIDEDFLPSPKKIIEYARPVRDHKLQAADEYDRVLAACNQYSWQHALGAEGFSETTRRAVGAAGGIRVMALAEPADEPHVRRRFIEYYAAHAEHEEREGRVLALSEMDPRAAALVSGLTKQVGGGDK